MKFKNKLYIFFSTFILTFSFFVQTTFAIVPFSGPILMSYECSCSGSWIMVIYDYTLKIPTMLTFQLGVSMPRANYNMFVPTVQTVGSYIPGGICAPASLGCTPFPTIGTITPAPYTGIGTGAI